MDGTVLPGWHPPVESFRTVPGTDRNDSPEDRGVRSAFPTLRTAGPRLTDRSREGESRREQAMEVMDPGLVSGRVPAVVVEPRPHAARHSLDDRLVLELDPVAIGTGPPRRSRVVGHVGAEPDPRPRGGERFEDLHRQSPGIEVEHRRRDQPDVVRPDRATEIRVPPRE